MVELLTNQYFVLGAMTIIIFALTQLFKQAIKFFTKKIANERARRMVNATILLIPFALGFVGHYLYDVMYLNLAFDAIVALGYGMGAVSFYGVVERFFKVKNPYDTAEGKEALNLVNEVVKDGKVDNKDLSAVERFYNTI